MSQNRPPDQFQMANTMMSVVTQVGCGTVLLIGLALGGGMLLDDFLNTGRIITVILMVVSAPVSLWLIFRIWLRAMHKLQLQEKKVDEKTQVSEETKII